MALRFRPNIEAMAGYVPGEQPPAGTRLIKLNTNENPYPPSPSVAHAIARELHTGEHAGERLRLYSDPAANELRQAAADASGLSVDEILAGNGSDELLAVLVRGFVDAHETVMYPYPTYLLYESVARIQGTHIRTIDFDAAFALPPALVDADARLLFVANPNAPSGTLYSRAQIAALAAARPDRIVVIDEAYADFSGHSAVSMVREHDNLVVLRTLSKSHSLAGMRVGLLYACPAIVAGLAKVRDSYSLDRLAIVAGAASLRDGAWTARNTERVIATRERLTRGLSALGLSPLPSHANFVFVRLPSVDEAVGVFRYLRECGILVRYFANRLLDDAVRITVGTDAQIDALLSALSERP